MRWLCHTRPSWLPFITLGVVVALLLAWPGTVPAQAADARLESATQRSEALQQRLDEVLGRLEAVEAETARVEDRVAELRGTAKQHAKAAKASDRLMLARVRDVYKRGHVPAALSLFGGDAPGAAVERARLLALLAVRDRADAEQATVAHVRADAMAAKVATAIADLERRQSELAAVRRQAQQALDEARAHQQAVERTIAAEQAARERAARQRAARQAAASAAAAAPAVQPASDTGGGGPSAGSAPVSGGIACPVGRPRSYRDTWGAPRSGGRTHKGTDIMAPNGTPSYAYESGTVSRLNSSSLGGISLYLRGSSGNVYYYTHLSGYASGIRAGSRVSAGDHIAFVGDTGNARGIPHLHFEVAPGGGASVNPYPYVQRACG